MKKIKLSENLELSQVVMGCMRIADSNLTENELLDLVEKCLDMGVTSIDHAPVYGGYTCEKIFGDAVLRKRPELRDKMQLITKLVSYARDIMETRPFTITVQKKRF